MASILIIDDSEIIRSLLTDYLSEKGHRVDQAVNGADGVERALAKDYHLVFCDIHMPKKNGYETYKAVRAQKPWLPFIMTDSLPDYLAEAATQHGASACLTKPFDLDQVSALLDTLLRPEHQP